MAQANSDSDQSIDDSMPAGVSGPEEQSVTARLAATFDTYREEVADSEHAGQAMTAAMEAAEEFAVLVVAADDEDERKAWNQAKAYLNQLCDAKSALGRKDVRSYWKEQIEAEEQAATIEEGLPEEFGDLFCECLSEVTKTVLTDRKKDETEYELKFDDRCGTSLVIGHSSLMSHESAWKAYTSASGQYPERRDKSADGSPYTDSDWQNRIAPVIEDLETVEKEIGPRTDAYRSVENLIERSVAYEEMGDAVAEGGLWVGEVAYVAGDESKTVEELRVMREDIAQITSQHDVTDRGLQIELKARGLASPRVSGISESTYVNGSYQTYWCFILDEMPAPEEVVDEVEDPMDRLDDRAAADQDDDSTDGEGGGDDGNVPADAGDEDDRSDTPNSVDTDSDDDSDDDDDRYGKMGTFGGGNGGDEE